MNSPLPNILSVPWASTSRNAHAGLKNENVGYEDVLSPELREEAPDSGSGCKKHLKIKGTRNYYFKTIGYCSRTKVKSSLTLRRFLCNLALILRWRGKTWNRGGWSRGTRTSPNASKRELTREVVFGEYILIIYFRHLVYHHFRRNESLKQTRLIIKLTSICLKLISATIIDIFGSWHIKRFEKQKFISAAVLL